MDRRFLLDTNIVLFSIHDKRDLDKHVQITIENPSSILYVSAISVMELIMLTNAGRFRKKWKDAAEILPALEEAGMRLLPVNMQHLTAYANLQPVANHNDPFDHLIIAQAIAERMPLISSDSKFKYYVNQKLTLIENER
jgi:PIN domain nuclease of toxin-antitoxin system